MLNDIVERPKKYILAGDIMEHPALTRNIYRYDDHGRRWYCDLTGDPVRWAASVTALIHATRPTPEYMVSWRADLGNEKYRQTMRDKAAYGTWMHTLWNNALMRGTVLLDEAYLFETLTDCPADKEDEWVRDGQRDLLAFAAWYAERQPVVYAIEPVVMHKTLPLAGAIDCVARLSWGKSEVMAIVDFKSGRNGFYEAHELQLHAYMDIWNSWFAGTEFEITHVFNLAPKNWTKAPACQFKDQSGAASRTILPHLIDIFMSDPSCGDGPKPYTRYSGHITLGETVNGIEDEINPVDIIKERIQ